MKRRENVKLKRVRIESIHMKALRQIYTFTYKERHAGMQSVSQSGRQAGR
jgi:hypothetical protein